MRKEIVTFRRDAAFLYESAVKSRRDGDWGSALELLRQACETDGEKQVYAIALADLYAELGRTDLAEKQLLSMSGTPEVYLGLASSCLLRGDIRRARSLTLLGLDTAKTAEQEDALEHMLSHIDYDLPRDTRRRERSRRLTEKTVKMIAHGTHTSVAKLVKTALRADPSCAEPYALIASVLASAGRLEEATESAVQAVTRAEGDARLIASAARAAYTAGQTAMSEKLLRDRADAETDPESLKALAAAAGENGLHELAADCAKKALQKLPLDRELLHMRAAALNNLYGENAEADACRQRSLSADPTDLVAQYYLGHGKNVPYEYALPVEEEARLYNLILDEIIKGFTSAVERWKTDPEFFRILLWASGREQLPWRDAALVLLTGADDEEAHSAVRLVLFRGTLTAEEREQVLLMAEASGVSQDVLEPIQTNEVPDPSRYTVGERQLLKYTTDCAADLCVPCSMRAAADVWDTYREHRPGKRDVLTDTGAAAAALTGVLLPKADPDRLDAYFGVSRRRTNYYKNRILHVLDRAEGDIPYEDL